MKEIFKQIIRDFYYRKFGNIKKRDLEIPLNSGKIISITGPRRAGKSYFLYSIIVDLLANGVKKSDIIFVNFEDERLDIEVKDLHYLIDAYLEIYEKDDLSDVYLFFDEIQNIKGWEKFVRRIYDEGMRNIFITGSNSKLLSKEISTSLRGRSLNYEILSLSFREFLRFKGFNYDIYSTVGKSKVLNLLKEYLIWGGFPEIVDFSNDLKMKTLQEYFDVMIYGDIVERYNVRNFVVLKYFIKNLIQSTTKSYSINKIFNNLKSMGLKVDKNDLYKFLDYIQTVYFAKSISKFDYSLVRQILKKIYLFDNGYLSAISFKFLSEFGKLLENVVFIELYRRYGDNIFFLKNGSETDFVVNLNKVEIYQVTYRLEGGNYKRELKGCMDGMNKFGLNSCNLITFEQKKEILQDGKKIKVVPFYEIFS